MYNMFLKENFKLEVKEKRSDIVKEGFLKKKGKSIKIKNFIPRFYEESYCNSFSVQWNKFKKVQLDSKNSNAHSKERFFGSTKWYHKIQPQSVFYVLRVRK